MGTFITALHQRTCFWCCAGPRRGGVLQHQATDQAFGRDPSAVWRAGGTTTVPVKAATLQRKHRGQIDGPWFYSRSIVTGSKHNMHRVGCQSF